MRMREKARERGERRRSIKEAPIATDSNKLVMSGAYNKPDIAVKSSVLSGLANKLNKLKTNQQENSKERKNFNIFQLLCRLDPQQREDGGLQHPAKGLDHVRNFHRQLNFNSGTISWFCLPR